MAKNIAEKLLVISEKGIGDALTLLPVLRVLSAQYPHLEIYMLAPGFYPLAQNVKDVAEILDHHELEAMSLHHKHEWLKEQAFHWIWNTENERSVWRQIIADEKNPRWISAPPHRTWPRRSVLALRREQLQRLFPSLDHLAELQLTLTPTQEHERREFRARFPVEQRLIAIHPSANDPTKVWPAEKFRELAVTLAARPATAVVFFLDQPLLKIFTAEFLLRPGRLMVVTEPLHKAISKLAACHIFVGNDSGFYHLAFALGLRVVGIYRSRRNARVWGYRSPRSRAVYFYLPSFLRKYWGRYLLAKRVLRATLSFRET